MLGFYNMSLVGTSHERKGVVCQDANGVRTLDNGWIVAVVADGLGSKKHSEKGANIAVNTIMSFVDEHLPNFWHEESLIALLNVGYHEAFKAIKDSAIQSNEEVEEYDTTLTTIIYNGLNVVYGHVGDGGVITLSPFGDFKLLTKVQKGEEFNATYPLRSGPNYWTFGVAEEKVCSLLLMTDGVFDVAVPWLLNKTEQPIYVNFVRPFIDTNLLEVRTLTDFEKVQDEIAEFLSGNLCSMITDDKTIIGIINTEIVPELNSENYYEEPNWKLLKKKHDDLLYGKKSDDLSEALVGTEVSEEIRLASIDEQFSNAGKCDLECKKKEIVCEGELNANNNADNPIESSDCKGNANIDCCKKTPFVRLFRNIYGLIHK